MNALIREFINLPTPNISMEARKIQKLPKTFHKRYITLMTKNVRFCLLHDPSDDENAQNVLR